MSDVNISHFKFAGLNSGVQPSLDLALSASDTTVTFTGFTNLQGNLDFVYINPLAIIRGNTDGARAYTGVGEVTSTAITTQISHNRYIIDLVGGTFAPSSAFDTSTKINNLFNFVGAEVGGTASGNVTSPTLIRVSDTQVIISFTADAESAKVTSVKALAGALVIPATSVTVAPLRASVGFTAALANENTLTITLVNGTWLAAVDAATDKANILDKLVFRTADGSVTTLLGTPSIDIGSTTVVTITFTAGAANANITSIELPESVFATKDAAGAIMTFVPDFSLVSD